MRKNCQIGHIDLCSNILFPKLNCFFLTPGPWSRSTFKMRIRIQQLKLTRILADPDPGRSLLPQGPDKACLVKQIKCAKGKWRNTQKIGKMCFAQNWNGENALSAKLWKWENAPSATYAGNAANILLGRWKAPRRWGSPLSSLARDFAYDLKHRNKKTGLSRILASVVSFLWAFSGSKRRCRVSEEGYERIFKISK